MYLIVFIFIILVVLYFVFVRRSDISKAPSEMEQNRDKPAKSAQSVAINQSTSIQHDINEPIISEALSNAKVDKLASHSDDSADLEEAPARKRIKFAPKKHQLAYDKRTGRILASEYLAV
jgi:hypothetical protein